jgi:stage IV sporulation protein FB
VILLEPPDTPYDLHFRLGSIPVRVNPWFWVMGVILFWSWTELGFGYLALAIACLFVSILIHELGHVFMYRLFGADGRIVLYSFGGLAIPNDRMHLRWQRMLVSFGGPLAQFILSGVIWLLAKQSNVAEAVRASEPLYQAVHLMIFINFIWALVNLLPIWPLDGGQISREIFEGFNPQKGLLWSLGLSVFCSGVIAAYALIVLLTKKSLIPVVGQYLEGIWCVVLFGCLAFGSYRALQQLRAQQYYGEQDDDYGSRGRAPWERDPDYWKH